MSEDKEFLEMCWLNAIEGFCNELDFLADPHVEEKMVCSLDCCIGNSRVIEMFLGSDCNVMQSLLGDKGIDLIRQYDEMKFPYRYSDKEYHYDDDLGFIYYDDEKGFSKKQRWLDFVSRINIINFFFKDILRKHGR